jgi:ketosteroid isomerase-like protein
MSSKTNQIRAIPMRRCRVSNRDEMSRMAKSSRRPVLAAAHKLIQAFSRHDRIRYFRAFSRDANFMFHTHSSVLATRAEYEQLWSAWEVRLGFRVLGCESSEQSVQMLGGSTAIFRHRVITRVSTNEGVSKLDERETIVFERMDTGKWMAVHEHLSPTHQGDAQAAS